MNRYSAIALEIMRAGLRKETCAVPRDMVAMVTDMFAVPECPPELQGKRFKMHRSKVIAVPVSGGLDSTIVYERASREVYARRQLEGTTVVDFWRVKPFYVNLGQPYANKELNALEALGIPDLETYNTLFAERVDTLSWKHIIPGRNLYILSLLAEKINGGEIWFGAVDGEIPQTGGDKSEFFLSAVNTLFAELPMPVRVETPLSDETKTDLVEWWLRMGYSKDALDKTVSCFDPDDGHCGECQACFNRWVAYSNNDLELKTRVPIRNGCAEYIQKYRTLMGAALKVRDFSKYSERRCVQTLMALERL